MATQEKKEETLEETLFEFVKRVYPLPKTDAKLEVLRFAASHNLLKTWKDFAMLISAYLEKDEDKPMNVTMSSTWAVCQEFLGNLSGIDLQYSKQRGGIWASTFMRSDQLYDKTGRIITVREILTDLIEKFPSKD